MAGYLRGRALQEYNLLRPEDKASFAEVVEALRVRLDPGGKAIAAQDFRHTVQFESESVADFVRRLERMFRIAYGRDSMSTETKDTLLFCQLLSVTRRVTPGSNEISFRLWCSKIPGVICCCQE